jgi:hypothetical protein
MKTICIIAVVLSFICTIIYAVDGNIEATVANFNLVLVWLMLHYFIRKGYLKSPDDN